MAAILGRLTVVSLGGVAIGKKLEATLDIERNMIESTTHDSAGWAEFLSGTARWTVTGQCYWDDADNGQDDLLDRLYDGASATVVFEPQNASGTHEFSGSGFVSKVSLTGPNEAPHGYSFTIQGTGQLTRTAEQ